VTCVNALRCREEYMSFLPKSAIADKGGGHVTTAIVDPFAALLECLNPFSPDGSSPDAAIVVRSESQEYSWARRNFPGYKVTEHAVAWVGARPYDVWTLCRDGGEQRKVYFDISWFYPRDEVELLDGIPAR